MLSRLDCLVVLEKFVEPVDKLSLWVGFILERLSTKLEMNVKSGVSNGYGDLRC